MDKLLAMAHYIPEVLNLAGLMSFKVNIFHPLLFLTLYLIYICLSFKSNNFSLKVVYIYHLLFIFYFVICLHILYFQFLILQFPIFNPCSHL